MEYEVCATCMCTDLQHNAAGPPEQCSMCGGYQEEQLILEDSSVNVGQVKGCYKCCKTLCVCCLWHFPFSEWLCAYPMIWLARDYVDKHTQNGFR